MIKKLSLIILSAIFLCGCCAPAPASDPSRGEQYDLGRVEAPGSVDPLPEISACSDPADLVEDAEPVSSAEYFLFSTTSNTLSDDDGMTLLYENQCIPSFVSPDSTRSVWVTEILSGIARNFQEDSRNLYEYALDFVELNGSEHFYSHSNYQQIAAARHDEAVVSLISLSSLYAGGSHPNSVQTAYNLDIAGQRILRLEDVIMEDASDALARLVRAGVDSKFAPIDGGNGLFEDYGEIIEISMCYGNMTPYWYLNDVGLVIFYNQYELGPYAAGIIKVELPYAVLDGILREEFYPAERDSVGDLVLCTDLDGRSRIPITIEKDGETLFVGVEGKVYQVQLSEVLWLEDTPISQNLLFSALSLDENDVLEIIGGYTDEDRSFVIAYTNGKGEFGIYYIHDGELSAER